MHWHPKRCEDMRDIPAGATICSHFVEPFDCRICFPRPRMHRYEISTGKWFAPDGNILGTGYSGAYGASQNNPQDVALHNIGPIPPGKYTIFFPRTGSHGPYALPLWPDAANEMHGRSAFMVHGDRVNAPPGHASEGCIILPRSVRELIWGSGDRELQVTCGD